MKYAIIGTGAVGGYYGGRLALAGNDVHFLLHGDYEYIRQNGLQVDSCDGSFRLDHVNAYRSTAEMPPCDVVLVALKSTNNALLGTLLPPLLRPDTLVVMIQNGIGIEADVQRLLPGLQLAAGLAFICSSKTSPGRITHQDYGYINIGNYSCRDTKLIDSLISDLQSAGIRAAEVEYHEARWKKAVWNMPFNGMTVVLDTHTDLLLQDTGMLSLIREQMLEVIGAARALGVGSVDAAFADKMIGNTLNMKPYLPSMKLDYDYRRPMEIYYLYTRPIEEARKAGFSMPRLGMLEAQLRFMEAQRAD